MASCRSRSIVFSSSKLKSASPRFPPLSLFALTRNVISPNFHTARLFAQRMNEKRDLISFPEQAVKAGQINAMGLIDEILHYVIGLYRQQRNSQVMAEALDWLQRNLGQEAVDKAPQRFTEGFPALAVYPRDLAS